MVKLEKQFLQSQPALLDYYSKIETVEAVRNNLQQARNKIATYLEQFTDPKFSMEKLVKDTSNVFKGQFKKLFCQGLTLFGGEQQEYALLGIGSISRNEMTPYSDIEFMLLLPELEGTQYEAVRNKFQQIFQWLQLRSIHLGETPYPLAQLSDTDEKENILKQALTPAKIRHGFCFDPGERTPWGREDINQRKLPFKLIGTIKEILPIFNTQEWLAEDYRFFSQLSQATLIAGSKKLYEDYQAIVNKTLQVPEMRQQILTTLQNDLARYHPKLSTVGEQKTKLITYVVNPPKQGGDDYLTFCAKHDFYRLLERTMDALHLYSIDQQSIEDQQKRDEQLTIWAKIEQLSKHGNLDPTNAEYLKTLLDQIMQLRYSAYLYYQGQVENFMLAGQAAITERQEKPHTNKKPIYIVNTDKIINIYAALKALHYMAKDYCYYCQGVITTNPWQQEILQGLNFKAQADYYYNNNHFSHAYDYYRDLAIDQGYPHNLCDILGKLAYLQDDYKNAIKHYKKAIEQIPQAASATNQCYWKAKYNHRLALCRITKQSLTPTDFRKVIGCCGQALEKDAEFSGGKIVPKFKLLETTSRLGQFAKQNDNASTKYDYLDLEQIGQKDNIYLIRDYLYLSYAHQKSGDYKFHINQAYIIDYLVAQYYFKKALKRFLIAKDNGQSCLNKNQQRAVYQYLIIFDEQARKYLNQSWQGFVAGKRQQIEELYECFYLDLINFT